jgi:hypothetical protein
MNPVIDEAAVFLLADRAAAAVTDRDAIVHCSYGDVPAWDYFWQLNVARSVSAHDIARHVGLDYRLPEDLACGMYEGTAPAADMWRSFGILRPEVPVATDTSWQPGSLD